YFEEAPEDVPAPDATGGAFRLGAVLCVLGILFMGVLPSWTVDRAGSATLETPPAAVSGARQGADRTEASASAAGPAAARTAAAPAGSL
ncbi:MAG TPA: hypothetical protein VKA44_08795, partial [Gemmatimonadota bacterium]|nr:hypothetical protein [Gemmatimonadota bacterium]